MQKEEELQLLLKWVENFPCACPRWLWGTEVELVIYDPDYMKLIVGWSGERTPSYMFKQLFPLGYMPRRL